VLDAAVNPAVTDNQDCADPVKDGINRRPVDQATGTGVSSHSPKMITSSNRTSMWCSSPAL
jgi:hypothetical protein